MVRPTLKIPSICGKIFKLRLTLLTCYVLAFLWRRSLSYRNQSIDLQSNSLDWLLYDRGLRHERVKGLSWTCKVFQWCLMSQESQLTFNLVCPSTGSIDFTNRYIQWSLWKKQRFPVGIYLLKVNNRNIRTRCEIYSKLTMKAPERR